MLRQPRVGSTSRSRGVVLMGLARLAVVAVGWLAPAPAAGADFKPHAEPCARRSRRSATPSSSRRRCSIEAGTPNYDKPESREVFAADQVGRAIVSGGNFQEIELQDGSSHPAEVLRSLEHRQQADDVPAEVRLRQRRPRRRRQARAPAPCYVGGRFTKITDASGVERNRVRLALINLDTCTVEVGFNAGGINSKVNDIVFAGSRLFIGGDFTEVGGQAIETIAELDSIDRCGQPRLQLRHERGAGHADPRHGRSSPTAPG